MKEHLVNPQDIEKKSFEIIENELNWKPKENIKDIILRVIHTTADFEYAKLLEFKNGVEEKAEDILRQGSLIYADTSMLKTGINNNALKISGNEVKNYIHDKEIIKKAKENKTTRSIEAINKAILEDIKIFAIGNAPTALFHLIDAIKAQKIKPDLIIATPIGFVGAEESKKALDEIDKFDIPYIRVNGRKGGSAVAASILNSLLYRIGREW